jgi:putative solute:sodium symporter small subunit
MLAFMISKPAQDRLEKRPRGAPHWWDLHSPRFFNPDAFADGVLREDLQSMADSTSMKEKEEAHWSKTSRLMFTHLGIWFFFGFIIHMFVVPLNKITIPILGFPLGFYMAAQGSLIVFVVMLFLFAKQQDKIDREFGFAEED